MAAIGFMGGFPTKYVLEKLGAELRRVYGPVIDEAPPEWMGSLLDRLQSR